MRKRVFIGSSSEELGCANIVKSILEPEFEVIIWDEKLWDPSVFKLNGNFLTNLLTATLKFDYGILLGTPDDRLVSRDKEYLSARDNVLFELGLFIGRLGIDRCAFLVDEDVKIPSDFGGIKLSMFNSLNLSEKVTEIKQMFIKASVNDLNFFPSSTLASSYFENFVKHVCEYYISNNGFNYNGVKYSECIFKILIPLSIGDNVNMQVQQILNQRGNNKISFETPGRVRNISVDKVSIEDDKLMLFDVPTTLSGINHAISNLLPKEFNDQDEEYSVILNRELTKFMESLELIIKRNNYQKFVKIERTK